MFASRQFSKVAISAICISLLLAIPAAFAAEGEGAEEPARQLGCRDVGLSGVTTEMGSFCIKTSGEMTTKLVAQKGAIGTFNARLMYDARLLSQDHYLRAVIAFDVTLDAPDAKSDDFDGSKSELFLEYEDLLVGRAETVLDAAEPLNYLALPIGWKNPEHRAWQLKYAPTLGIFKLSFAVEVIENAWESGKQPHYVFNAKSSEIWGELSFSHFSRPVLPSGSARGSFTAASATVPIPQFVGTKVRLGVAHADGLVSYLGTATDDASDDGWSAFISGEHLIGDDVTLAATFGRTDTKKGDTTDAIGLSLAYEPDFDTVISAGITHDLTNHGTQFGIKATRQINDHLEITAEAKKHTSSGYAAILEIKSAF